MAVPSDCRIFWFGTVASIPSGWSRDTNFDDRYLSGAPALAEAGTNGGSATHNHTSNSHSHIDTHVHSITITGSSSGTVACTSGTSSGQTASHTHSDTDIQPSDTPTIASATVTITATATHPVHTTAIVLKPNDGNQQIPADGVILANAASGVHSNFLICNGSSSTVDLNGRFIKTAAAGADGGGTGGSSTHTHSTSSHAHSDTTHSHPDSTVGGNVIPLNTSSGSGAIPSVAPNHHTITGIGNATITWGSATPGTSAASNDPAYRYVYAFQNKGSATDVSHHMILPYVGLLANIPSNWYLCDSNNETPDLRSVQCKITTSQSLVGTTGGSNSHTHTGNSHNHTATAGHNHTYTFGNDVGAVRQSGATNRAAATHTHTSNSMNNTTPTTEDSVWTMSSDDIRYWYREAQFIMYKDPNYGSVVVQGGDVLGASIL